MMKNRIALCAVGAVCAVLLPSVVYAATTNGIATMGDQVKDQIGSLTDLIGAASFVVGLVFGASGLLKFKQHSDNPQGNPLSHAMVRLLVAGLPISLPAVMGTSVGTLFSASVTSVTSSGGGNLTSINRF